MIVEQTAICRYKTTGQQEADVEIQMTVQLERPTDPYDGGVEIHHLFEPIFPEELDDEFFQRLNNGVHRGYAHSNIPYLPNTILAVKILELRVSPSPQSIQDSNDKVNLGYLLEVTVSGIVDTLCRSLENLRTGEETH
jgi:hypothetical protein